MSASDKDDKDIVIVGGGSTGVTAVIALAQALAVHPPAPGVTLHLFDPQGFSNGGVAYGKSGSALLNETAGAMSPWSPGAFTGWCANHGYGGDPKAFHERRVFGAFLNDEYRQAVRTLRGTGVDVIEHREAVTSVARSESGRFTVAGPSTALTGIARENFILASGYGRSEAFSALDQYAGQGYVPSLYPPDALAAEINIKPGARVLAVGTGPALYDALRLLPDSFGGSVVAVSPSGTLPDRRDVTVEGTETRWSLTEEYRRAASAERLSELIDRDLSQAQAQGSTIRRIALDIQKDLPVLLRQLDETEQRRFVRGSLSRLFHACTPVPDVSWNQKEELKKQGRFEVRKGRVSAADIVPGGDGFTLGDEHYDIVVNCAGHDPLNQPLVKLLLQNGLAQAEPGLCFLKTGDDNYHLSGSGLACIGPATHIGLHGVESFYGPVSETANAIAASLIEAPAPFSRIFPVRASAPQLQLQPAPL